MDGLILLILNGERSYDNCLSIANSLKIFPITGASLNP